MPTLLFSRSPLSEEEPQPVTTAPALGEGAAPALGSLHLRDILIVLRKGGRGKQNKGGEQQNLGSGAAGEQPSPFPSGCGERQDPGAGSPRALGGRKVRGGRTPLTMTVAAAAAAWAATAAWLAWCCAALILACKCAGG